MSDSMQPHRWQPTRPLCPWDSPGKNTGVCCQRAEHKFPFVKVFPLPPLSHTKRKRIITRSRKIAEKCVCTNTKLTTVTLIFHNLPTYLPSHNLPSLGAQMSSFCYYSTNSLPLLGWYLSPRF